MPKLERIYQDAVAAFQARRLQDAEHLFKQFLKREPKHFGALSLLTSILLIMNRYAEAEPFASQAVRINGNSHSATYNHGLILKRLGKPELALKEFERALRLNPKDHETWNNRGIVFNDLKKFNSAISDFNEAISLNGKYAEAYCNKGNSLFALGQYEDSLSAFTVARELQSEIAEPWVGCGNVLHQLKKYNEAIAAYDKACALQPTLITGWLGRGNTLFEQRQYSASLTSFDRALAIDPASRSAWVGRANALQLLQMHIEAIAAYQKALALDPTIAEACLGQGNILRTLGRHEEALTAYNRAIELNSNYAEAWASVGNVHADQGHYSEAERAQDRAFALNADLPELLGNRLFTKMNLCNWKDFDADCERIISEVNQNKNCTAPFAMLSIPTSASTQLHYAKTWAKAKMPVLSEKLRKGDIRQHEKIRIAYVSGDFREHPVSYLLAGVFEKHNRNRFEVLAISLRPGAGAVRSRLERSFDEFISVENQTDEQVAELIRQREIDILIDLMGYTAHSRPGIFAQRPAPIQIALLGYPGTTGTRWIDYLVADRILVPPQDQNQFSEKMIYLPNGPMPSDDLHRRISDTKPDRADLGLPENGFVFCCFNNNYKINPRVLDGWATILKAVEGSVLWLSGSNETTINNLRNEAMARGIDYNRLIFAPRVASTADHLARHRAADLFLDTLPYNAHTTASDALWAGLPVLTQIGKTYAGRVGASLLTAIGLPELITSNQDEFERFAISLAASPSSLAEIKEKLAKNILLKDLFNTQAYTRHLESSYAAVYERYKAGEPAEHMDLR